MLLSFTANIVKGAGRGKTIGTPTINLDPSFLSTIGEEGIYAVRATLDGTTYPAVMHAGPRPVFGDTPSIELHLLVPPPDTLPATVTVELISRIREIRDFPAIAALQAEIGRDVASARATLGLDA